MGEKRTTLVLFIIALIVVGITIIAYNFKDELDLSNKYEKTKDRLFTIQGLSIKFSVDTSTDKDSLSIRYYVPCSSLEQRADLLKRLPVIKNGIIMAMNKPKMITAVYDRDFKTIRRRSLNIINRYIPIDVDKVYIDYFSMHTL